MPVGCRPDAPLAGGSYPFSDRGEIDYQVPAGAVINRVHVTRLPVFDEDNPREDYALYRWANRIHRLTRATRVEQQLLIASGEPYDQRRVEESARLLRRERYLYDADVRPLSACDGRVDVEVITRDVWSLTPDLSFSRSGGENEFRIGLRESNVLGHGFEIGVIKEQDFDRDTSEIYYRDDNVRGTRIRTRVGFSDNDDGSEKLVSVGLPFFELDARRAWHVSFEQVERTDSQYFRGDEVTEVQRDSEDYLFSYGWSAGLQDGRARRWTLGYRYETQAFAPGLELPPPGQFPTDRKLSYPFLDFSQIQDDFDTGVNLNQIHRIEDIHVGYSFFARLGLASESLGSDQDRVLTLGSWRDTLVFNRNIWLAHELSWWGLFNLDTRKSEDVVVDYQIRYQHEQTEHRAFFASLQATYTSNLNTNRQLLYGGDTGARAFDNRFQAGDRRVILTLEERVYTDLHILNLLRVGFAVFLDVGRAWEPDVEDGIQDDYLASAGIGLRLASSKSDAGQIMHVDLAFPLTNRDDPDVERSEVAVRLKRRF